MVHQLGKDCGLFPWALLHWAYTDKMHPSWTEHLSSRRLVQHHGRGKDTARQQRLEEEQMEHFRKMKSILRELLEVFVAGRVAASPKIADALSTADALPVLIVFFCRSHLEQNSIRHGPNIPFQTSAPTSHGRCRYVSLPVVARFVDWCPSHNHVVWHFCYILLRLVLHKTCMKFMCIHALIRATPKIFPLSIYPHLDNIKIWFKTIVTETWGVPRDAKKVRQFLHWTSMKQSNFWGLSFFSHPQV